MLKRVALCLVLAGIAILLPTSAFAQKGQIAGIVRDSSGGVLPGVTVEVTSPALIEKVRSTTSDSNGQYRITNLPVGTYTVSFTLEGFQKQVREDIALTSGFTAPVSPTMSVGQISQTETVIADAPVVDVQNPRQAVTFDGTELRDLPTTRNINSLLALTPGISSNYRPGAGFGQPGVCVGGIGTFCNPGLPGFNQGDSGATGGGEGGANLSQGRVMVDGAVINSGTNLPLGGMTGGYTADIVNVQEINIQLNGALGESETGGASINIIPRTGGNRYAGEFNSTYVGEKFFDRNTGNYPGIPALVQSVKSDYDVSGAFGGPILRDRLWFYSVLRKQQTHKLPTGTDFWPNLHEGKWGYNYQPDRSQPRVEYKNMWRNANARITLQATQKNKFNIFWDEQDFCQDPCLGVVSVFTSPESWWSVQLQPNRLQQLSWTNPYTSRLLFEAGLNITSSHYDTTRHREYRNPREIPRISENGSSTTIVNGIQSMAAGGDDVAPRVNAFAGGGGFELTSGSLNNGIGGGAEVRKTDNYRTRASASYITGTHNAKVGWDGGYYLQDQTNEINDLRLTYNYTQPASTCLATNACGNVLAAQFPNEVGNPFRRPRPATVNFSTGQTTVKDRVWYGSIYAQDQWTLNRFTLSGALRYDHAESRYGSSCIGGDQEPYMRIQADGTNRYCTPETDGVDYDDITPRFGAVWDVFGDGKTAVKFNMGKYLNQANISGLYSGANPARNSVNSLTRNWNDADADRIVDCDLLDLNPNGECGTFTSSAGDVARYALNPFTSPVGLNNVQCGRESGDVIIQQSALDYCAAYGDSLLQGWGKRRYEWQIGIGVQREILPRLSGEVTYNRRLYRNITSTDQIGLGCDQFNGAVDARTCQDAFLNYQGGEDYDFYEFVAPVDPRLPGGGGYRILGLNTSRRQASTGSTMTTIVEARNYYFHGIDTNFVWRGPRGIRINGGTSTSRSSRDTCYGQFDAPNVAGREGREHEAGCRGYVPFLTNVNGSASYTIPWVDVLLGVVFQSLPGPNIGANLLQVTPTDPNLTWLRPERLNEPCTGAAAASGNGCFGATRNGATTNIPLLLSNEIYGERTTLFDVKFAKNLRFAGKRMTVGVDVYNVFNSDAIQTYQANYEADPAENEWMQPTGLVSPRMARFSLQFSF
jgi:hypothetical protein